MKTSIPTTTNLVHSDECRRCAACCSTFTFYSADTPERRNLFARLRFLPLETALHELYDAIPKTRTMKARFDLLSAADEIDFIRIEETGAMHTYMGLRVIFTIPCGALSENDGYFECTLWDSQEKPDLCRSYPSHMFTDTGGAVLPPLSFNDVYGLVGHDCPAILESSRTIIRTKLIPSRQK